MVATFFVFLYFFKEKILNFFGWCFSGLIYIFKNIWLFGYPFSQFRLVILCFWLPNSEILKKQSSEVAITKPMIYNILSQKFKNLQLGIIFTIGLHCILTKIHPFCIYFVLIFFGIFAFKKKDKLTTILFISILFKSILIFIFGNTGFFLMSFFVIFVLVFHSKIKEKLSLLSFSFGAFIIFFLMNFFLKFYNLKFYF